MNAPKEIQPKDYLEKSYWSREEVAHFMGKTMNTIYAYRKTGLIFNAVGMINKEEFFTWLNER